MYLCVFSPNAGKYGLNNFKYGHFSRSDRHLSQQILNLLLTCAYNKIFHQVP